MKLLRLSLSTAAVLFLVAGYAASVRAALTGEAAAYATRMDQPPIRAFSLLFLLAAVALAFVRDEESPAA